MEFSKLMLEDISKLKKHFDDDNTHRLSLGQDILCDQVIGTNFMWRNFFETQYAVIDNSLVLKTSHDDNIMFSIPFGNNITATLKQIKEYAEEEAIHLYFCFISELDLHYFHEVFDRVFLCEEADWFDYLYDKKEISELSGKKFHGQKNHVNRFKKNYPDAVITDIRNFDISKVTSYISDWFRKYSDTSRMSACEEEAIYEILCHLDSYGMIGGVIENNGAVMGVTIGETIGNTLFVHVEKADHSLSGSYQFLSSEFLRYLNNPDIQYVNREEDMGIPGLRTSKESLHPIKKLKKYTLYCI